MEKKSIKMEKIKTSAKWIHISIGALAIPFAVYLWTEQEKGLCCLALFLGIGIIWDDIKKWNQ